MGIIEFVIIACILGLIAWAVTTYLPLPSPVKTIIIVAVVIVLILLLMQALGLLGGDVQIPEIG